ncbi:hypothetical protein BC937DRAFT_92354 [Endogone sp. FLAS-F59071]|nr:hypothetical protein BC937DRAFT_92354 [Endogone sp. FLAS-F59071]|eukprot:RUS15521.1 hypothetical protein BC937DRAFT_92354 [Endogone sp. FLAS-F59071]
MTTNVPSIPESVKRDDADHAMYYSQSLPYAFALGQEANEWLDELCVNIAICVKARDWSPGCLFWVKRLNSYMDLKHAVPRPIRAKLAKLLFELVVMPGMDTALVEIWANACVRLIKKKMKLGPEDLILPWGPLYLMIDRTFFPKSRQRTLISESYPSGLGGTSDGYGARSYFGMPWAFFETGSQHLCNGSILLPPSHLTHSKQIGSVFRLAEHAQRFFPASATEEILAKFLPKFNTHSVSEALTSQAYIVLLLPTQAPNHSITHAPLPSPVLALTPRDYLPTIFTLWAMLTNSYTYDAQFLDLVARVAEANVGVQGAAEGELDAGLFTAGQVRTVFSVGLRIMELPVGSKADGSSGGGAGGGMSTGYNGIGVRVDFRGGNALFLKRKQDKFKMLARFIVFTMYADTADTNKRESTLTHLANLIQATESYYHPSNYGRWSYSIVNFLRQLSWEFLKRWRDGEVMLIHHIKQTPECTTPPAKRLTPAIRHEFVLILRSVTFLSLFGKDLYSVSASQATIKYLACEYLNINSSSFHWLSCKGLSQNSSFRGFWKGYTRLWKH